MANKENENRFELDVTEAHGLIWTTRILVDKQTGVNYLFVSAGYGGGLTPLLDSDGNIVVTPQEV